MKQYLAMAAAASLVAVAGAAVEGAFTVEGTTTASTIACADKSDSVAAALPNTSSKAPG
jgi:hypothetical protein